MQIIPYSERNNIPVPEKQRAAVSACLEKDR
jgi:hypothetical protein